MTNHGYLYVKPRIMDCDIDTMRMRVHNMLTHRLIMESKNNRILRETAVLNVLADDKFGVYVKLSSAASAQEIRLNWRDDEYEFQRVRLAFPSPPDPEFARIPVGSFEYLPHIERHDAIQFDKIERKRQR